MDRLDPFEPKPAVAVAVSGGADSLALAVLAQGWTAARGGTVLALVIDHGLRAGAAEETRLTLERLATVGIPAQAIRLDLAGGPGLAERARAARYTALVAACAERGVLHLLLGHHRADQAETVLIRALSGSGADGLAGMGALRETGSVRLLRPLLDIAPGRLRATLRARGLAWVEDPSNANRTALRPRLRRSRGDPGGDGAATRALAAAAGAAGRARAARDERVARALARVALLRPEGFAVLDASGRSPGVLSAAAWGALLQAVSGAPHPPSAAQLARLAAAPGPATLGGVQLLPAGRLAAGGLLLVREAAAMAGPVPAARGVWDGRFRLARPRAVPPDLTLGALGEDAAALRGLSSLPHAVLRTLPALRAGAALYAVPHLDHPDPERCGRVPVLFAPSRPAGCAPFFAGDGWGCRNGADNLCLSRGPFGGYAPGETEAR